MVVLSWPALYALEITPACNNRCPGCSNLYSRARQPAPTDAATWERWLTEFGPEAVQIRLTGGEPTLHPEFMRILAAATSYEARVTIFTNGRWAAPRRLIRQLLGRPRLAGLLVSLHGCRSESHEAFSGVTGSFHETVRNVRLALDAGITVALSTIITRHSLPELAGVVELAQGLGVQHVAFNRYLGAPDPEIEPTHAQMQTAVKEIERLIRGGLPVKYGIGMPQCFHTNSSEGCLAGVAYVAIDPWGRVHPCSHSPSLVGSLHEMSLAQLWRSAAMEVWRALMPLVCIDCAAYTVCHGGCRAVQELRADRRDPLRGVPLTDYRPDQPPPRLPASARPRLAVRLRPEPFGYAVLGQGQVMPVSFGARAVIEACDGRVTLEELASRFGQGGLDLLGELCDLGVVALC
jgi:radical SAM protein with 4Fe4S-binding SPASM domain